MSERVYCEPVASDAPDGRAAANLVAGARPPESRALAAVANESSAELWGLENQQRYACGVASADDAGNLGPLSNLLCARPNPNAGPESKPSSANSAGAEISRRCDFTRSSTPSGATAIALAALTLSCRRKKRAA